MHTDKASVKEDGNFDEGKFKNRRSRRTARCPGLRKTLNLNPKSPNIKTLNLNSKQKLLSTSAHSPHAGYAMFASHTFLKTISLSRSRRLPFPIQRENILIRGGVETHISPPSFSSDTLSHPLFSFARARALSRALSHPLFSPRACGFVPSLLVV